MLPGYREKVSTPMDFLMIEDKVKKGKYANLDAFRVRRDVFSGRVSLQLLASIESLMCPCTGLSSFMSAFLPPRVAAFPRIS